VLLYPAERDRRIIRTAIALLTDLADDARELGDLAQAWLGP
jgi:hypothetical protein